MFIIRQAMPDDVPTLLKLAKMVHFINLPADPDIINRKITRSRKSFSGKARSPREREFVFVIEDTETGNVVGTSSVISCVSWPGHPHTFLQVRKREHYSNDLQTGVVHTTLQLGTDETGPTEIGGLILGPSYRGHRFRLGSLISLIRFHYMGLHRKWFSERVIAEMMGPLTNDTRNLLWEYLGRRFINLDYAEADRFCQTSKEFMTALLPRGEIYICLLPPEARQLIGRVGTETEPAKAMLEKLGFMYKNQVDPFDGGPYLEAQLSEIPLVVGTRSATLGDPAREYLHFGLISTESDSGFRAVRCHYAESGTTVSIPPDAAGGIGAQVGDSIGLTPLPVPSSESGTATDTDSHQMPPRLKIEKAAM